MPVHRRGLCAILLGLGVGWGAGNVGPVATVVPIVVIPLMGGALGSRDGPWAFLALAAFLAAIAFVNLLSRPRE